jgi:Flp pilus assembly protein TadB
MTMGLLVGGVFLLFSLAMLLLFAVVHVLFSIPLWLLIGGAVLYLWLRKGGRRHRYLGSGRYGGYLDSRSRW